MDKKNFYWFCRGICRIYLKLFHRLEVIGHENCPEHGSLIVMANHISYFDPPVVGSAIEPQVFFMAKEELFVSAFGLLLRKIGTFPVKRGKPDRKALKTAFKLLKEKKFLGVFPEGTTKKKAGEKFNKAQTGAVRIALKSQAPILPVGIYFASRFKIKVAIGKPFSLDKYYKKKVSRDEIKEAGELIMEKIKAEVARISD